MTTNQNACPVIVEPADPKQVAADAIEAQKNAAEFAARATARQALLDKLGITADEAKLLLG